MTNARVPVSAGGVSVAVTRDATEQHYKAEVKTDKSATGAIPVTL